MKGIAIVRAAGVPASDDHPIAGHHVSGHNRFRSVAPPDYSLWMVLVDAAAGAVFRMPPEHGDEALYVSSGSVAVDGRVCPAGGAVVLESGSDAAVEVLEPGELLHMGPVEPGVPGDGLNGPVERPGEAAHVVGPAGWFATTGPGRDSRYYADSTCPNCRLTLLYTSRTEEYESPTHSHSVDELIHVLWGRIQLGSHVLGPGDTLAVEADRRYGFRAPDGFGFLNYRCDASEQTVERGTAPRMEGALVNGFEEVGDLR